MKKACKYTKKTLSINQLLNRAESIEWFKKIKKKEECTYKMWYT